MSGAMPPAYSDSIEEGAERDGWFAVEVRHTEGVIWWARTRYGRASACSVRQSAFVPRALTLGYPWIKPAGFGGGPGGLG